MSVWISKSVFICYLGPRQHCCSFFILKAPGLALSLHFRANETSNFLLDIHFSSFISLLFWWILHLHIWRVPFWLSGQESGVFAGSYSQLEHTFPVAFLLGFVLAIYTVGFESSIASGLVKADGIGWIFSIGVLGPI